MSDNIERPRFGVVTGKTEEGVKEEALPTDRYVIHTHNDGEFEAEGFLLFTSHHVAVMRDGPQGAKPILVVPLSNVVAATSVAEDLSNPPF